MKNYVRKSLLLQCDIDEFLLGIWIYSGKLFVKVIIPVNSACDGNDFIERKNNIMLSYLGSILLLNSILYFETSVKRSLFILKKVVKCLTVFLLLKAICESSVIFQHLAITIRLISRACGEKWWRPLWSVGNKFRQLNDHVKWTQKSQLLSRLTARSNTIVVPFCKKYRGSVSPKINRRTVKTSQES